jgi:hypothetical protein
LNDLVNGAVGFAVGGIQFGVRAAGLSGSPVEEAVGEGTALAPFPVPFGSTNPHGCDNFRRVWRETRKDPAWLLERAEFEPSSPFISHSVGDLVGIWILRKRNRLDEKDSVRVGPNPDPARQSEPVYFLSPF